MWESQRPLDSQYCRQHVISAIQSWCRVEAACEKCSVTTQWSSTYLNSETQMPRSSPLSLRKVLLSSTAAAIFAAVGGTLLAGRMNPVAAQDFCNEACSEVCAFGQCYGECYSYPNKKVCFVWNTSTLGCSVEPSGNCRVE